MYDQAVRASEQQAYESLCVYTLEHARQHGTFIHQYVVDAFAAQRADATTRPVTLAMALIGLYLHVECGYSGTEVQRLQMAIGRNRSAWPDFVLPVDRGRVTVLDVVAAPAGPPRDHAIAAWCRSVWDALSMNGHTITELLVPYGIG
jgi:hypothetical protein